MKINAKNVILNRIQNANPNGTISPNTISLAKKFDSITEDIFIENENNKHVPFVIIPLTEGSINVLLAGNTGEVYTISEEEVKTFIGQPMLYLVDKIIQSGTTVTKLSIGI